MKCTIEKTKRQRVRGLGPKRDEMVTFAKLGNVSDELLIKLNEIADRRKGNDLGSDNYNISQLCNVDEVFIDTGYRQILIQERKNNIDTVDEHEYTEYNEDVSVPFFKNVYRLRISEMSPGHEMNWHIDTDTSVMCRAQICLNENDSVFQFKRRGVVEEFQMKPGEMWFINTGWLHRVVSGNKVRRSAIFGFDYEDYNGNIHILSDKN
jgi:hypothetical protein